VGNVLAISWLCAKVVDFEPSPAVAVIGRGWSRVSFIHCIHIVTLVVYNETQSHSWLKAR